MLAFTSYMKNVTWEYPVTALHTLQEYVFFFAIYAVKLT